MLYVGLLSVGDPRFRLNGTIPFERQPKDAGETERVEPSGQHVGHSSGRSTPSSQPHRSTLTGHEKKRSWFSSDEKYMFAAPALHYLHELG